MEYKKLTEMLNGKRIVIIGENIDDEPATENIVAINGQPLDERLVRVAWRMAPGYIILKTNEK